MKTNGYFNWMCQKVCSVSKKNSYSKLLVFLNSVEFVYMHPMDENRLKDGIALRYRYAWESNMDYREADRTIGEVPCSVLEMMVALALKCENILSSVEYGDRTEKWFWDMIKSLGFDYMTDEYFDYEEAESIIFKFLNLAYDRTGKGGLFTVYGMHEDMRNVEIWQQMHWYMKKFI